MKKEQKGKRNENLKIFYNTEYLSEEIKVARQRLTQKIYPKTASKEEDMYLIATALQRIGIMIYIGGIDLSFAILMNGFQILSDWILV